MKTLISIFMAVFFLFSFQTVFAAQAYFDWEKDMDLIIEYNSESDDIYAAAALKSETNQNDQFSLGLFIDGREYRKFFKYDSQTKILFVDFNIPQSLTADTSIFLSVKDAQYNEVYSTIPSNYTTNNVSRNNDPSIKSVFGPSFGQKDYGVFSMMVSTSSKNIVSYQGSTTSTKRVNISDLTRSELIGKIQTQDFKKEDVAEIIKSINKLKISIDDIKMSEEKTVEIFKSNNYTPVYKSQEAEPKKINGIGNSNSYNSWRIER